MYKRQEFVECAKALTKDTDGDGEIDQWGFSMVGSNNSSGQSRFMSYLWSNGFDLAYQEDDSEEWKTDISSDQAFVDVFSKWTNMNNVEMCIRDSDYTYSVDHFVRGGETQSSKELCVFSGGKGLNQSIALSKSGAPVWHAGAVGQGDGEFLIRQLEEAGVHTEYIARVEGKTGHAIIQKAKDGGNCILLFGGANQQITEEMVDQVLEHFEAGDYLVLQNEVSQIRYMMEQSHKKGMNIVLSPSPMDEKIASYPLEYVDYFLLNEIEAGDICGESAEGEVLLGKLAERFPGAKIVLTLGGDGSLYREMCIRDSSKRSP